MGSDGAGRAVWQRESGETRQREGGWQEGGSAREGSQGVESYRAVERRELAGRESVGEKWKRERADLIDSGQTVKGWPAGRQGRKGGLGEGERRAHL